jgi:hypothetical protein
MVQQDHCPSLNITSLNLALLYGDTTNFVFCVFTRPGIIKQVPMMACALSILNLHLLLLRFRVPKWLMSHYTLNLFFSQHAKTSFLSTYHLAKGTVILSLCLNTTPYKEVKVDLNEFLTSVTRRR